MTTKLTVETPDGYTLEYVHASGLSYGKRVLTMIPSGDLQKHINGLMDLDVRDDDVYLATFPKSGTHWVWEILVMLRRGNAEYETKTKEAVFLDFQAAEEVHKVPSPRVLNCHYPCKLSPRGIFEKKNKIVHVMRNPKDVFVSYYFHHKSLSPGPQTESFKKFLPIVLGNYGLFHFYPWYNYVKEWERFSQQNPDQILNLYFEDLKENPVREIKKINEFLETGRDDDLIQRIAQACDFHSLKRADSEVKIKEDFMKERLGDKPSPMYRKGEVGDWKNHFTVAENERMDKWLEENMYNSKLKFRYTI